MFKTNIEDLGAGFWGSGSMPYPCTRVPMLVYVCFLQHLRGCGSFHWKLGLITSSIWSPFWFKSVWPECDWKESSPVHLSPFQSHMRGIGVRMWLILCNPSRRLLPSHGRGHWFNPSRAHQLTPVWMKLSPIVTVGVIIHSTNTVTRMWPKVL